MKFIPTSRDNALYETMNLIEGDKKVIIISINEEDNGWYYHILTEPPAGLANTGVPLLTLNFADIDKRVGNLKMFDENMAGQIFTFVEFNNNVDVCLVHCYAGISRSPAVCAGLSLHYNNKCDEYFEKYIPNPLVFYRMVEQSYKLKTKRTK